MRPFLIAAFLGLVPLSFAACGGSSETCRPPPSVAVAAQPPPPHEHTHMYGRAAQHARHAHRVVADPADRAEDRRTAVIMARLEARLRQIQRRADRQVREAERAAEHARRAAEEALRHEAARLRSLNGDDDDDTDRDDDDE